MPISTPNLHPPAGSKNPEAQPSGTFSRGPRVAYLLSRYPAVSHTFFLKEVLGLRQRGLSIEVASINPPDRPKDKLPAVEAVEADQTLYIKSGSKATLALNVLRIACTNPGVALRGMRAALKLGGLDIKAHAFSLFYWAEALLVGDWMRRRDLHHLHVHFGGAVATVGMLTAQAWNIPWSVTLHGPDEFFDQDAFYLRQKIDSAAFVICISDFCRSQVLRIAPATHDSRLEIVRLGVDCEKLQPRADSSRGAEPVRLVCTGRLVAAKGHFILIHAVADLLASGLSIELVLIGDGAERRALETLCRQANIDAHVHFRGAMAHDPTLSEVAQADIFVLASFAEGLPVALMEAMALGVPCVSTIIAAIPELIVDGVNGRLVPASNWQALAVALRSLAEDEAMRQQLGAVARATVVEQYNLGLNLDRLADVWRHRLPNRP